MNKQELFDQIKKDFPETRWAHSKGLNVSFMDVWLDPYNIAFVGVLLMDDKTLLTDFADTAQIVDFKYEEFQKICEKHGVIWDDWTMEREYHSNDDIVKFKECLAEISDLNWERIEKKKNGRK